MKPTDLRTLCTYDNVHDFTALQDLILPYGPVVELNNYVWAVVGYFWSVQNPLEWSAA